MNTEADVIVVGSGAGGGTIAKELSQAGMQVLVLERGRHHTQFLGTHIAAGLMADRFGMRFSKEGLQCVRALTFGGSTMFTCGTFQPPAPFIKEKLGIDLTEELEEVRQDLWVQKLPDELLEGHSELLMEAANGLGYHWTKFDKMIDAAKCRKNCSSCMLTCPTGAKWTSRVYLDRARKNGTTIIPNTKVTRVLHKNGRTTGVTAKRGMRKTEFRAPLVILTAGGLGSAPILKKSGIEQAGRGIFIDPLIVVGGVYKGTRRAAGATYNSPMSVGTWEFYPSDGFMLSPLIDPWLLYLMQVSLVSPLKIPRLLRYPKTMSIMVKIKDDMAGAIDEKGRFSKPLTAADRRKLDKGGKMCEEILVKAGCDPKSLLTLPVRGAHPGGACPMGSVVDKNLETEIKGLFVSDASVFPESLGTPVVATVASMNKRLAKHILADTQAPAENQNKP